MKSAALILAPLDSAVTQRRHSLRPRGWWLVPVLAAALLAVLVAALSIGALPIAPASVVTALANAVGFETAWAVSEREALVIAHIRAPRAIMGALAGAALAIGGVLMQALFRNPLADPALVGVSSGAAVAAAAVTVIGSTFFVDLGWSSPFVLPAAAFVGGWLTVLLTLRLARSAGQTRIEQVLLAGIAINALAGAAIGLLMLIADDAQLREVAFWSFGSLGRANWPSIAWLAVALLPALVLYRLVAPWLNALLLGEGEAALLGVPVERVKRGAIIVTCLAVGATVAFTGLIGFVGLVAPHIVRLLAGPDHRVLLPAAGLLGAVLLPLADLFARTVAAPVELPIGLVTALLGAPFFLFLLLRERREIPR